MKYEDRPYQGRCIGESLNAKAQGITRQLIVMATGLGKTVTIGKLLETMSWPTTYAVMHREELLDQAASTIRRIDGSIPVGIEKAESVADHVRDRVILASVQTVGRKGSPRLSSVPAHWPGVLWIDESHHAPAGSYLNVVNHFGMYGENPRRDGLLIGTTATPDRLDELGYDKIFDDVVFRYDLRDAIRDGWLSDIKAWTIQSDIDLSKVKTRGGDFVEKDLADAVAASSVNAIAAKVWSERCRGQRSLFFCVDKLHAETFKDELKKHGARVAVIVDSTPKKERREIVEHFRLGEIEALVNVGIATEGFDVPEILHIHILRPTQSNSFYTQMVGRGTRKIVGVKESVEVYDYTGQQHDVCSVGQIFGLPDSWAFTGGSVSQDADKVEEIEAELGLKVDGAKNMADLVGKVKGRRLDLIRGSISDSGLPGKLAWIRPSRRSERWVMSWRNETQDKIASLPDRIRERARQAIESKKLWGKYERMEIFRNELGRYEAKLFQAAPNTKGGSARIDSDKSLSKLVSRIEKMVVDRRPHKANLLKKNAKWGLEPSSDKQRQVLKGKGVPEAVLSELTKREASTLINTPKATIQSWFSEVSQ